MDQTPKHLQGYKEAAAVINELLGDVNDEEACSKLAGVLGDLARKKGTEEVAKHVGIARESLYKALRGGPGCNPRFETVLRTLRALGFELVAIRVPAPSVNVVVPDQRALAQKVLAAKYQVYEAQLSLRDWLTDYENKLHDLYGPDHPEYRLAYAQANSAMKAAEIAEHEWKEAKKQFERLYKS